MYISIAINNSIILIFPIHFPCQIDNLIVDFYAGLWTMWSLEWMFQINNKERVGWFMITFILNSVKKTFACLTGICRFYTTGWFQFLFALYFIVPSVVCVVRWTIFHQVNGYVPCSDSVSLIVWHFTVPFSVSRLWDCLVGPVSMIFLGYIVVSQRFEEGGSSGGGLNNLGLLLVICTLFASMYCTLFGILSIGVAVVLATLILFCLLAFLALLGYLGERWSGGTIPS